MILEIVEFHHWFFLSIFLGSGGLLPQDILGRDHVGQQGFSRRDPELPKSAKGSLRIAQFPLDRGQIEDDLMVRSD